jgi:hypothetical protein
MEKIWYCLFEEFLVRQMYWIFHNGGEIVKILDGITDYEKNDEIKELQKEIFLMKFNSEYSSKSDNSYLINCLKECDLFMKVIEILSSDDNILHKENLSQNLVEIIIANKMLDNFKKLLNDCDKKTKDKLYELLLSSSKFYKDYVLHGITESKYLEKKTEILKVKAFLKSKNAKDFITKTFGTYRGNKLLLITFFAQKKVEEKGFMEELEKNYGIYLDVDNFIKGMKDKLKEITSYQQFFKYIGSEYGSDKNDVQIFNDAYEKAEKRGYFSNLVFQNNLGNSHSSYFRVMGRGRGRGRGRGGW